MAALFLERYRHAEDSPEQSGGGETDVDRMAKRWNLSRETVSAPRFTKSYASGHHLVSLAPPQLLQNDPQQALAKEVNAEEGADHEFERCACQQKSDLPPSARRDVHDYGGR